MPTNDYLPKSPDKFAAWLQQFNTVAAANQAQLGLTDDDLAADTANLVRVAAQVNAACAAAAAAKAANRAKTSARNAAAAAVRAQARRIQAQSDVPNTLRVKLGLPVHKKPGRAGTVAPLMPVALAATPHAGGANTLIWKPAGNKPGTIYVVQALVATPAIKKLLAEGELQIADGAWAYVTSVSAAKFVHTGCVPGQTMYYRIIAKRGVKSSDPSDAVMVYGP